MFRGILIAAASVVLWHAAAAQKPTEVTVGAYVIPGSPSEVIFKDYAKRLKENSGGSLAPNMLIHGEGGAEEQVLTSLRRGRINVASLSTLVLSSIIPELGLLSGPYLYNSTAEFDFIHERYVIPKINALAAEKDLVALRWIELGPLNIYAKKPLLKPADARGVAIRVSQDMAAKLFLEAVGADVIYLPSPDVIPALQTGLIQGGITPTIAYAQTGLTPEAPHFTMVEYTFLGNLLVANKAWLDRLPEAQRTLVADGFAGNAEIRAIIRGMVDDALARQTELGFTAYTLSPEQRAAWVAATAGVNAQLVKDIGGRSQDLLDAIAAGRQAMAAQSRPTPAGGQ
ncbi:MAG: TRAP transporter substrate-binding protein [Rhodospirillaceae bacterium]|nr:TRAP transporter substrate-binding protein [Rhodospirillaceae bacterium]